MNPINKFVLSTGVLLSLLVILPSKTIAQPGYSVSYQTFYDELQPYGTWVEDANYGDVWVPNAEDDFMPYASNGHWVITPYGNTWVSDYPWGWAAFHYGRWRYDDYYGWEWIPGRRWGPAWVNWRSGGGYYAWAPLGPNISLDVAFGNNYVVPDDYWVCAPQAYICNPYVSNYYIPRERVVNVIHQTTIIRNTYVNNNVRYVSGPRTDEIQRVSNMRVPIYNIGDARDHDRHTVIQNNTINIFRPTIVRPVTGGRAIRPATVVNAAAYRQANPDAGIAYRNRTGVVAATINHTNASRLAQTANNPQPQQGNLVKVTRPAPAIPNNAPNNGANPAPANGNNPASPDNGNRRENRGMPNNAPVTSPQGQPQQQPAIVQPAPQQQPQLRQFRGRQPEQQAPQNQPAIAQPTIQQPAPQQSAPQNQPALQQQRQPRFRQPQQQNQPAPQQNQPAVQQPVQQPDPQLQPRFRPPQQQPVAQPQPAPQQQQQRPQPQPQQQPAPQPQQQRPQPQPQQQPAPQQQQQRPQPQPQQQPAPQPQQQRPQQQPAPQPQQQRPQPQPQQQPAPQQQQQRPQPQPQPQQQQQRPQPRPAPQQQKPQQTPPPQ